MSNVHICRKHDLDEHECEALAVELLEKLVSTFGGRYSQKGQNYSYRHTAGVKALVEPKAGELIVDVTLGMMTRALAPQLESEMNKVLDDYLA